MKDKINSKVTEYVDDSHEIFERPENNESNVEDSSKSESYRYCKCCKLSIQLLKIC